MMIANSQNKGIQTQRSSQIPNVDWPPLANRIGQEIGGHPIQRVKQIWWQYLPR
jgi:hypothetical protein